MAQTKVFKCNCNHKFQDTKYGKGRRVHNPTAKDGEFCCTVCSKVRK